MQRTYRFIEFDVTTAGVERTGRVLDFDASNRADAVAALLYTLRQSSGSTPWEVGETGRSVLVRRAPVGSKGYALEYDVDEVKDNREERYGTVPIRRL